MPQPSDLLQARLAPQEYSIVQATAAAILVYRDGCRGVQLTVVADTMARLLKQLSGLPRDPLLYDLARAVLLPEYTSPGILSGATLNAGKVSYAQFTEIFTVVSNHFRVVRAFGRWLEG